MNELHFLLDLHLFFLNVHMVYTWSWWRHVTSNIFNDFNLLLKLKQNKLNNRRKSAWMTSSTKLGDGNPPKLLGGCGQTTDSNRATGGSSHVAEAVGSGKTLWNYYIFTELQNKRQCLSPKAEDDLSSGNLGKCVLVTTRRQSCRNSELKMSAKAVVGSDRTVQAGLSPQRHWRYSENTPFQRTGSHPEENCWNSNQVSRREH